MEQATSKAERVAKRDEAIAKKAYEKSLKKSRIAAILGDGKSVNDFFYDENNNKIGIILGTCVDGMICIGWSMANIKAGDAFDRAEGLEYAHNRAIGKIEPIAFPHGFHSDMLREFQVRCLRYFKQATVMSTQGAYVAPVASPINMDSVESLIGQMVAALGDNIPQNGPMIDYMSLIGLGRR